MSNDLGIDRSGNGNNWSVNNIAFADQVVDSPTNNFCTLNPLDIASDTLLEGNLKTTGGQDNTWNKKIGSTMSTSTTKIYFEVYQWRENAESGGTGGMIGISPVSVAPVSSKNYNDAGAHYSIEEGFYYYNGGTSTSGHTTGQADVIGMCAYDPNTGKVWFGVNGTWNGSGNPATGANPAVTLTASDKEMSPFLQPYNTGFVANFGQDSSFAAYKTAQGNQDGNDIGDFYYTPPSGFLALCTSNLPDVAVTPSEHFNTILYTGNGSARNITGVGFQPDWMWLKQYSGTTYHRVYDSVRGAGKEVYPNDTAAEYNGSSDQMSGFLSDGFSVPSDAGNYTNTNNETYVAWNWKVGGSGVSNTDGNRPSTVSVNDDAGISIVTYTGNDVNGETYGHGLTLTPELVIMKAREGSYTSVGWGVIGSVLSSTTALKLDTSAATVSAAGVTNNVLPTATTFSVADNYNHSGSGHIAYCFHSVDGYSKVGSYTGNDSTDGPFVYTGFRPAWVMTKSIGTGNSWWIIDNKRDTYNEADAGSRADDPSADMGTYMNKDLLSNGFKIRTANGQSNGSNSGNPGYIYIAFAETPFKYSNAR